MSDKTKKPFYGINVGKGVVNLREYPSAYESRPTRIYLKEDGAINDEPSFAILMENPVAHPVLGQLSLSMFNKGLDDVGYVIRKKTDSREIGEHIEGCNIKKIVDENEPMAYNCWNVRKMRVLPCCDKEGNELTPIEFANTGHSEMWLEFPCAGEGCGCVKRVRMRAITNM